jgi:iron complex outermembrane recepter protein
MKRSIFAIGASLFALIDAMPAAAQSVPEIASASAAEQASDSAIEDIVVTAQRREERLQTTPIAITALTGEA